MEASYTVREFLLSFFRPIIGHLSKPPLLPRFALLWDDYTIYLGEIYQLSTIGRFFFPSNVDFHLKICEYALHVVVEKVSAGSKQERKGEAEYHLKLGKWFLWKWWTMTMDYDQFDDKDCKSKRAQVWQVQFRNLFEYLARRWLQCGRRKYLNALREKDVHHPASWRF